MMSESCFLDATLLKKPMPCGQIWLKRTRPGVVSMTFFSPSPKKLF